MSKRTNRQVLEFQADRIEAVLARHKVSARVTGGVISPRWVQFQVLPALAKLRARPALKCPACQNPMVVASFFRPAWRSG